jgi:hypothetical protein
MLPDAPVNAPATGAHGAGQGREAPTERRATLTCAIASGQWVTERPVPAATSIAQRRLKCRLLRGQVLFLIAD